MFSRKRHKAFSCLLRVTTIRLDYKSPRAFLFLLSRVRFFLWTRNLALVIFAPGSIKLFYYILHVYSIFVSVHLRFIGDTFNWTNLYLSLRTETIPGERNFFLPGQPFCGKDSKPFQTIGRTLILCYDLKPCFLLFAFIRSNGCVIKSMDKCSGGRQKRVVKNARGATMDWALRVNLL